MYEHQSILVNTARWMDGQGTAVEQGNGRVDVLAAARVSAILVCDSNPLQPTLSFGAIDHGGQVTSLVQPLRLIDLAGNGGRYSLRVHLATRTRGLSVALSHRQATLGRFCSVDLELTATLDGRTLKDGAYYGFVVATRSDGEALRLPFHLATQNASELRGGANPATGTVSHT